jgi:hypothetical protein
MRERTRLTIVWCAGNGLLVKVGGRVEIVQRSMAEPRARRGVPPRAAQRRAREGPVVRWGAKASEMVHAAFFSPARRRRLSPLSSIR